jgi:peptidyl-prolyl cis-trans isomerase SurA
MNVPSSVDDLRNQILLQRLRDRELEARVKVTELDIDQYLRDQQQRGGDPALTELNLAHILVAVPEGAPRRRWRRPRPRRRPAPARAR